LNILHLGAFHNVVSETWIYIFFVNKIYFMSSENRRKFLLHFHDLKANDISRLKKYKDINIAIRPEIAAKHGSKQRQFADMIAPAERF
jgi:hypothetical protein